MLLAQRRHMATKRTSPRTSAKRATGRKKTSQPAAGAKRSSSKRSTTGTQPVRRPRAKAPATAAKKAVRKSAASGTVRGGASAPLAEYNAKRDFSRTAEPAGKVPKARGRTLHFVIQKHAASHLHYDFRLELDGVMKSWAVPKGPSLDPTVRRLAMEVEDHPISYNSFEGTIPKGEYGGGTVMLWDQGVYEAEDGGGAESLRRGYEKGELRIQMHGQRLRGGFVLARLKRPGRPQWLLIKRRDDHADPERDITAEETSIVTKRTMDQIAAGRRVWHSNR
jgi:bifunctional non-homologous end joining protein LigD